MSEKGGKFMGKRICVMAVVMLTSFCVTACNKMTKDDLVWTNENIVYAYVNAGYEDDILKDLEGSFRSLSFQKVYAAEGAGRASLLQSCWPGCLPASGKVYG